jgi:thiamine biosynthesis lipoprotein
MALLSERQDGLTRARPMLGTLAVVEIAAGGGDPNVAIEAAFGAIGRVDQLMHPSRAGSDLARIAAAKPGQSTEVDPWTFEVLQLAQRLNEESGGVFDPCLPPSAVRMRDLELRERRVTCRAPATIDLGGIAKGFAVDCAADELLRRGVTSGLVNVGGDLRVFGTTARAIHGRSADGASVTVEMRDGALAVSAPRSGTSPPEHRGYYDGVSGARVAGRTVVVAAPTAVVADALCKCAMLCDPSLSGRMLEAYGARLLFC